jgi:predicted metalloprotease with PDZ domain
MISYKIFSKNPANHFITVEIRFKTASETENYLQLPAWRPGRYELQNFAKNIARFEITTDQGPLPHKKTTKDCWQLAPLPSQTEVLVSYDYYANKKDAGNSYIDPTMLYINPVNCCAYIEGRQNEAISLEIAFEGTIVSGLRQIDGLLHGHNFYELADSPTIIAKKLDSRTYTVHNIPFNIHVWGNFAMDWNRLLPAFEKFTTDQIAMFGAFPEQQYHFMLWVLPEAFYHGVEHRNSTMMVLGPDSQPYDDLATDLLGLASHELFHAWNICKIRPAELLPYNYTQENYFSTCYISEGVTTYYGDECLYRSGAIVRKQYLLDLETRFKHHLIGAAGATQNLRAASYDLWLDGYTQGIPGRKVSVYHKGAIAAQILDLHLKRKGSSLDWVMKTMYQRFGNLQLGFSEADYRSICEEAAGEDLGWYFGDVIGSNDRDLELLNHYLTDIDLKISTSDQNLILT